MKIIAIILSLVFILSFSVTAFADIALEEVPGNIPVDTSTSGEASSGDDYLDMVLNNIQNDITDLEFKTEELENEVNLLSESNNVVSSTDENVVSDEEMEVNPGLGIDETTPTSVNVYALNPITPEDTTGLKSVLLSLIGDYDAIVVEYEYTGSNNYSNYLREVQPDYVWLCSAAIFLVVIYSVFRLGGALFRG